MSSFRTRALTGGVADSKYVMPTSASIKALGIPEITSGTMFSPIDAEKLSQYIAEDIELLRSPHPAKDARFKSDYLREAVESGSRRKGLPAETILSESYNFRVKVANGIIRTIRKMQRERMQSESRSQVDTEERSRMFATVLMPWSRGPLVLEKPQGSSFHHLIEYDRTHTVSGKFSEAMEKQAHPQLFVVEHDWARVIRDADMSGSTKNVDEDEWPLPYDDCCFEFRISGVRVLAFITDTKEEVRELYTVYGYKGVWTTDDFVYHVHAATADAYPVDDKVPSSKMHRFVDVIKLVLANVRAVCITIDSRVTERKLVRAPAALVERRTGQGRAPLRDHHIVSLAPRSRSERNPDAVAGGGTRKRLHFRRGHWAHYRSTGGAEPYTWPDGEYGSRTWRNWMLVGDPDLGFVDKEYKL